MLKELLAIIRLVRMKFSHEKHELEQRIFFWLLKGTLCLIALVFLALSIFLAISNMIDLTEVASLITAVIFIVTYGVVSLIYCMIVKYKSNKADEKLNVLLPLIEAFLEGMACADKKDMQSTKNI